MATNPAEQPSKNAIPDQQRFQFTLRTLLELSIVTGLGCSLWAWGGEAISHTPEFFGGLAIVLIASCLFMRRWTWILGCIVVVSCLFVELKYAQHQADKFSNSDNPKNSESFFQDDSVPF
jgi:hypothetical protein